MTRTYTAFSYTCEKCGHEMVHTTSLHDPTATPDVGDITVCIKCGSVGTFIDGENNTLSARRLTGEEYQEMLVGPNGEELVEVLTAWAAFHQQKGQPVD